MASPATRRALGNINPNTPLNNNNSSSKGTYLYENMAGKERIGAGAGSAKGFEKEGSVESLGGSEKRGFGSLGGEQESATKRVKRYTGEESAERGTPQYGGGFGRRRYAQDCGNDELFSPSPSVSPVSSFGSSHAALNDSQQTVLTEPDQQLPTAPNSFTTPQASSPLTKEQARERSKKLRLRLQLAAYKVQTNQIEVPIDRLELRSSSSISSSPIPPRLSMQVPSATVPRPHTARERVPTIQLQGLPAEKGRRHLGDVFGSSPPPLYGGSVERSPKKMDVEYGSPVRSRLGAQGLGDEGGKGNADAARDLLLLRESASKKS